MSTHVTLKLEILFPAGEALTLQKESATIASNSSLPTASKVEPLVEDSDEFDLDSWPYGVPSICRGEAR